MYGKHKRRPKYTIVMRQINYHFTKNIFLKSVINRPSYKTKFSQIQRPSLEKKFCSHGTHLLHTEPHTYIIYDSVHPKLTKFYFLIINIIAILYQTPSKRKNQY